MNRDIPIASPRRAESDSESDSDDQSISQDWSRAALSESNEDKSAESNPRDSKVLSAYRTAISLIRRRADVSFVSTSDMS